MGLDIVFGKLIYNEEFKCNEVEDADDNCFHTSYTTYIDYATKYPEINNEINNNVKTSYVFKMTDELYRLIMNLEDESHYLNKQLKNALEAGLKRVKLEELCVQIC
jgi:hypothetical protein